MTTASAIQTREWSLGRDAGRNPVLSEAQEAQEVCSVGARTTDDSRMESASNIAQLQPQSSGLVANTIRINCFFMTLEKKNCVRLGGMAPTMLIIEKSVCVQCLETRIPTTETQHCSSQ